MNADYIPDSCPTWCTSDHAMQFHPEDRVHTSDGFHVPMVELSGTECGGRWQWLDDSLGLSVALEVPIGRAVPYIMLASDDGDWEVRVTPESAERLVTAVTLVMSVARG